LLHAQTNSQEVVMDVKWTPAFREVNSSGDLELRLEPARDTARGQGWEANACVRLCATRWRATCANTEKAAIVGHFVFAIALARLPSVEIENAGLTSPEMPSPTCTMHLSPRRRP
jgi:hypothetical protein